MASAGRILILPKGTWNADTTYEMLDLVKHNGTSWIAKKDVVGIEPSAENSEYWQDVLNIDEIVNSISLEDIGGLPADKLGQAIYVDNLMSEYLVPTLVRWDGNTANTPYKHGLTDCADGFALIYGNYSDYQTIIAWTKGGSQPNCYIHQVNGGTVHGWSEFFSTSGGTIKGSTKIQRDFEDATVASELYPSNYKLEDDYVSSIVHSRDGVSKAILTFNEHGAAIRDNVNNATYNMFGEHNIDKLKSLVGGSSTPNIALKSYQGKGTFGTNNPCSLTFDFVPRVILYLGYYQYYDNNGSQSIMQHSASAYGKYWTESAIFCDHLTTEYKYHFGFKEASSNDGILNYAKKSEDGKTVYWIVNDETGNATAQLNNANNTYYFIAIG